MNALPISGLSPPSFDIRPSFQQGKSKYLVLLFRPQGERLQRSHSLEFFTAHILFGSVRCKPNPYDYFAYDGIMLIDLLQLKKG